MEIRTASKSFQDLVVWQKAHAFVLGIYSYTNNFPKAEIYALSSQFKRAANLFLQALLKALRRRERQINVDFLILLKVH